MAMGSRRRAAALLSVVLAAGGLTLGSSPVSAADCPPPLTTCVVVKIVQTVDGQQTTIESKVLGPAELRTLSDDALSSRTYLLRKNPKSKGGKTTEIGQSRRVGINALLDQLSSDQVAKATFVETPSPAGVPSVLTPGDLADPDGSAPSPASPTAPSPSPSPTPDASYPFVDKLQPAVFLTSSGKLGYVRPLRDLDEDTNASDYFQVAGRLDLTVHTTGQLLAPTVTSSSGTELDRDARTTFSVSFADKPRTRIVRTAWDFGDGTVKQTRRTELSKSYPKKGTYPVAVSVRANDGSYGRSAAVEIKVANPPKAPSSGGTGGGTGGGDFGGGGGVTSPPAYDPFPDDFVPPDDSEEPPVEEEPPPAPQEAPVDDGLVPVEGYVLAGAEIAPGGTAETIPGTESSATPTPATQQSTRARVATWAVAVLAVALLVGLGAASETRWFRHRLRHLRRRA
jgi:PKD repeat protein